MTATTYASLDAAIRATGAIPRDLVMTVAVNRARRERAGCAAIGWQRTWAACMAWALVMTWTEAKSIRDNELALRERAALPVAEQLARTAELQAAIAESAIPPRHAEARELRARALAVRMITETLAA